MGQCYTSIIKINNINMNPVVEFQIIALFSAEGLY